MRIDGTARIIGPRESSGTARSGASGARFSLDTGEAAREAGYAGSAPSVGGLDAMLALQSVEEPLGRPRRAMRRGRKLLDVLDSLKLSLLDGTISAADVSRLSALMREERDGVDDPALEAVLGEIDLRAAVELAKVESRRR